MTLPVNKHMKVWELFSAFRSEQENLRDTLSDDRWVEPFLSYFLRFAELVSSQDREVLDRPVPLELSREVSSCSSLSFFIDHSGNVRLARPEDDSDGIFSALYLHDEYGGSSIEEVMEKGSFQVPSSL